MRTSTAQTANGRTTVSSIDVSRTRGIGILLLITLLGLLARLYKLDSSLWYDEVVTLTEYVRLPVFDIITTYTSLNNHIFYSLQAHASLALFGESAWALRLPAVIFGVATIPLLWLMVLRVSASVGAAHVSACLLALNYHHIWFSQNARGYTGLVFWGLLALYLLIEARRSSHQALWVGIAIAGALAVYTHLSAAFFLSGVFLALLIVEVIAPSDGPARRRFGLPFLAFAGAGFIALLLHVPVLDDILRNVSLIAEPAPAGGRVDALAKWKDPVSAFLTAISHLRLPLPVVLVAVPVAGVILLAGLVRMARWNGLMAATIPASIFTTLVCLMIAGMRIWPRFFLIDVVLLLVVAVASVALIAELVARGRASEWLKVAGWSLGILVSAVWATQNYWAPKQDFEGAVAFVESKVGQDDIAATFGLATLPISSYFAPDWASVDDVAALEELRERPGRTWILYAFPEQSQRRYPDIYAAILRDFEEAAFFPGTLGAGGILVWKER